MKTNEQYAYFSLIDFSEDPLELTDIIGIEPTEYWRKGDIDPQSLREHLFSRWSLYSRLPSSNEDIEAHIIDVLNQLDAQREAIREVTTINDAVMQLVGYFHIYYPGLSLSAEVVERLAYYHLRLDCDFYYLYDSSREDT